MLKGQQKRYDLLFKQRTNYLILKHLKQDLLVKIFITVKLK